MAKTARNGTAVTAGRQMFLYASFVDFQGNKENEEWYFLFF